MKEKNIIFTENVLGYFETSIAEAFMSYSGFLKNGDKDSASMMKELLKCFAHIYFQNANIDGKCEFTIHDVTVVVAPDLKSIKFIGKKHTANLEI